MSSSAAPPRWLRPSQFLVYLVPVGGIPPELFTAYARLLQNHSALALRSLTRPGGYAAELSPFRGLDWGGNGVLRFHFVSSTERVDTCDGEDVHASRRVVGVLGVCHSPSFTLNGGLRAAHAQFEASVRRFPGLLMHKLFAFEHTFEDVTAQETEGLGDLVMFPVHHELQGTGESTVSLHLQVVMDTLAVNVLMSLESAIRSATSTAGLMLHATGGDLASVLLDVNVEPHQTQTMQQTMSSPLILARDTKGDATFISTSSPTTRSSSGPSFTSLPSPLAAGVAALDPRNRRRKRQLARREKLLGDYSVLVSCVSDAVDHYTVAIDMLREEERRSGGVPADALWLAAALEGYVFCLYSEEPEKFSTELVEKASEAVALYAKAGTTELESLLIENLGWYYASVATATLGCAAVSGEVKMLESVWAKRLLWDMLERGLVLFPELQPQRQVEFLIHTSRVLETVGHRRRVALFLHEAVSLLLVRNAPSVDTHMKLLLSPSSMTIGPQRQRDLEAALLLERVAAEHLGIRGQGDRRDDLPWEVTTLYRKNKRKKAVEIEAPAAFPDNSWLIIRFHVLRQLLTIARMLGDALLVGSYCLQLLEMLAWCSSIAVPTIDSAASSSLNKATAASAMVQVDHLQQPSTSLRVAQAPTERVAVGLHAKSGVYFSPPPGIDTRIRRNFINSPSATMSNAAATFSSTLTNTPRILSTPRQQFSAAVNALSTKASPSFTSFSHAHSQHNGAMISRAGGVGSALRMTNVTDGKEFGALAMNGDNGSSTRPLSAIGGELEGRSRLGMMAEATPVWNLWSKTEIAKIERKLLNLLESDCTALRSSEQIQLPTFLRVDVLQLRSTCNLQHPFLSRDTALRMFGVQPASSKETEKADFFYSPFEKHKITQNAAQHAINDDNDEAPAVYERGFPVYERIELRLVLSNPTGVAVKLQHVKAWVTFAEDGGTEDSMKTATKDRGVECYPCFFTLDPYEKRKTMVLGIQPLRVGTFHVHGCFIKAFNIETSFKLKTPVNIRVVTELPIITMSLHEHGSVSLPGGDKAAAMTATQPPNAKMRIAMFRTETKRCVLRVRSTGNRPITNFRLAVTVQHRRTSKETCVIFNNLPATSATSESDPSQASHGSLSNANGKATTDRQIETQTLLLNCAKVVSSPLPLTSGGFVSIPFEMSLRGANNQGEPLDDDIQIEWSFVYADETRSSGNDSVSAVEAIFYRESKVLMELVSLPSLTLRSVSLIPYSVEKIPSNGFDGGNGSVALCDGRSVQTLTTDHSYCAIMVHVVNPTETTFRFRLHRNIDKSGEAICQAEIGRQCSRRFVVEVPRLSTLSTECGSVKLPEVLNNLLEMEWHTYFGTGGQLVCEEHHFGSITEQEEMKLELLLPPVSFEIECSVGKMMSTATSEEQNGASGESARDRNGSLSLHPSSFFQATHLHAESQTVQVGLFQYLPISIAIQQTGSRDQQIFGVEVEIIVTEEGEEDVGESSDQVIVVGLLQTQVQWENPMDSTAQRHGIQCLFVSEGKFCVTVCGQLLGLDMQQIGGKVWSHQPLHLCVQAEDVGIVEKLENIII